jgi:hypothetical protein
LWQLIMHSWLGYMIMNCELQLFLNVYTTDWFSKSASVVKVEKGASAPVTNAFEMHLNRFQDNELELATADEFCHCWTRHMGQMVNSGGTWKNSVLSLAGAGEDCLVCSGSMGQCQTLAKPPDKPHTFDTSYWL